MSQKSATVTFLRQCGQALTVTALGIY